MSKKLQLQIPNPCHENWAEMTSIERGRFCNSCQKKVVDFTNMSDREIAIFFKKPSTGSVCGRFMQDQLGRDIEIPRKRIPWVKYFFQLALPAFLASCGVRTQGKIKVAGETKTVLLEKPDEKTEKESTAIVGVLLTELVHDDDTLQISEKQIATRRKERRSTILPETKLATITEASIDSLKKPLDGTNKLAWVESGPSNAGLCGILGGISVRRSSFGKTREAITLLKQLFKDTTFHFRIYPNPLRSGSPLQIDWGQNETGHYVLQFFNQSGQLVFAKNLYIDQESLTVDMPSLTKGSYFLRIISKVSSNSYTEKIIIQ